MAITTSIEKVTPSIAKKMLQKNVRNRTLTPSTVDHYTRLMKENKWELNGDALRFAEDGTLLDGQHRLAAVVKSGATITILIVRGLEMEAQLTMDQQRKRTAGDALTLYDIPDGNKISAIVRMVYRWDKGERAITGFSGSQTMLSPREVLEQAQTSPLYQEAARATSHAGIKTLGPGRSFGTLYVLAARISHEETVKFFEGLLTGANLDVNHPILALRRYSMNLRAQRVSIAGMYLNAGVHSWNAYASNRSLTKISYRATDIPELAKPRKLIRL